METEYHIFKVILEGLGLNLTRPALLEFVQNGTGCTEEQFEEVYEQIREAWIK